MPRPPNYRQQRLERDRAARAKTVEKTDALREKTERRKAVSEPGKPLADGAE
jgi:hypothetical protein